MLGLGPRELILLVAIFLLFFGANRIPELARGIRDTIKVFRSSFSDEADKTEKIDKEDKENKIDKENK